MNERKKRTGTKLKTPAERTASAKISASYVRNDYKGVCACGCKKEIVGRKTKKFYSESCKQHTKRFLKAQREALMVKS